MADNELVHCNNSSWFGWLKWSKVSITMLRATEKKILSCLKTAYRGWYVDIGPVVGPSDKIWTISLNEESNKTPILLLHGLASGVALWCLNLDSLSAQRPVYAIDILGFGRSSRPSFSVDGLEAESQLVTSIEEWRKEMQLEKLIVLGHSLGGFLATSYAIQFPERVKHLILADPWGFPEKPADDTTKNNVPLWARAVVFAMRPMNPLWLVRAAGPWGKWVIEKLRPDITRKFKPVLNEDVNIIPQYLYHCNAQTPSGESAFHVMMTGFGWAKNPMCNRIDSLKKEIPITLLYGTLSWLNNASVEIIQHKRPESYFNIQAITGAGHHVYADKYEIFNRYVNETCELSDSQDLTNKTHKLSKPHSVPAVEGEESSTESEELPPVPVVEGEKSSTESHETHPVPVVEAEKSSTKSDENLPIPEESHEPAAAAQNPTS